jgi:hypothetical protein
MKNYLLKLKFITSVKKNALCAVLFFCFITGSLKAQHDYKSFAVSPSFGFGIGGFNPAGVNEYINNDLSGFITTNAELYLYEEIHFSLNFKFKWFDISPIAEYAIGPKVVVGADRSYFFNRLSPGVLANFFIPMGSSGKNALFIGGGAQYHMMSFEDFKGNTPGYRIQLGFDLQFGRVNMQPILAFNLANAKNILPSDFNNRDLNYTGGQIGINISFHKPVGHR